MFKRKINRGMKLLDKMRPGWDERIDLTRLDLNKPCDCVVGQEFGGDYRDGLAHLGLVEYDRDKGKEIFSAPDCGFAIGDNQWYCDSNHTLWERLTEEWREAICLRRINKNKAKQEKEYANTH